jgi:hypothetical protein
MRRTYIALILTPLLVSGVFGIGALVAFPFMLLMTAAVALPLLLFFKRIKQLNWWIAVLGGATTSLTYILLTTLVPLSYGVAPAPDRIIDSNNITYLGLGMLTGFVFWWIGIFRNAAFPFVSRSLPWSAVTVIPLAFACIGVNQSLRQSYTQGRVTSIDTPPTKNYRTGQATIHLTTGPVVHADLGNTWPSSMIQGRCVHVEYRWSTLRFRRVYEVLGPFGGGVDEC